MHEHLQRSRTHSKSPKSTTGIALRPRRCVQARENQSERREVREGLGAYRIRHEVDVEGRGLEPGRRASESQQKAGNTIPRHGIKPISRDNSWKSSTCARTNCANSSPTRRNGCRRFTARASSQAFDWPTRSRTSSA